MFVLSSLYTHWHVGMGQLSPMGTQWEHLSGASELHPLSPLLPPGAFLTQKCSFRIWERQGTHWASVLFCFYLNPLSKGESCWPP